MPSELDRAIALRAAGDGRFTGHVSEDFWVQSGPNGGYMAATALHGASLVLGDPERPPRALHARFLAAPEAGPFELRVETLRAGRSMTTLAMSMHQRDKLFLSASACFSAGFSSIEFQDRAMPEVAPFAQAEPIGKAIPLNHRYDMFRAIGEPLRTGARARTGGYIRFADPRPFDALAAAALWDAWPPAMFARAMQTRFRGAAPTVEVSVYFRRRLPLSGMRPEDYAILEVESTSASEGFVEEDGWLWSPDGTLLAQSRQLVLLI
jgi:acyl-CoA thioesterase